MFLLCVSFIAALPAAYIFHKFAAPRNEKIIPRQNKPLRKKKNKFFSIAFIIILFPIIALASGLLPYSVSSVVSESMTGAIDMGSLVFVEKINQKDVVSTVNVGDIVYFRDNINANKFIVHRVIEIDSSGEQSEYITKGDNNKVRDAHPVQTHQVVGIVKRHIPYAGYPRIWIQNLLT